MQKKILIPIVFCLFLPGIVSATDYFIDPSGSDSTGDGSVGSPWQHLSYACNQVTTPGDVVRISSGIYTDPDYCSLAVGVSIIGAGRDAVTISTSSSDPMLGGYISGFSVLNGGPVSPGNHEISGFTLDGQTNTDHTTGVPWGIHFRGRENISIHDMRFEDIAHGGVRIVGYYRHDSNYNWIGTSESCRYYEPPDYADEIMIFNNEFFRCTHVDQPWEYARQGAIQIEAIQNLQLFNNHIDESQNNGGTGIKICDAGWYKNADIHSNFIKTDPGDGNTFVMETYNFLDDSKIRNNTMIGPLSLNGGIVTRSPGSDWNLQIYNNTWDMSFWTVHVFMEISHNWLDFYNNYVVGNSEYAEGLGLWATNWLTGSSVDHVSIRNNVIYDVADVGFRINGHGSSYSDIEFYNNVIDTVSMPTTWGGYGIALMDNSLYPTFVNIHNNLILNAETGWAQFNSPCADFDNVKVFNNMVYNNGNSNNVLNQGCYNDCNPPETDCPEITGTITANPEIIATGLRPAYYYPSDKDSNLIDSGVSLPGQNDDDYYGNSRPQGSEWDIGAFEFEETLNSYYITDNSCDDNGPGTQEQPWCHAPQMEGWSGSISLNPGDTVYFNSSGSWNHIGDDPFLWIEGGVKYTGDEWGNGTRAKFTMDTSYPCPPPGNGHAIIAWYEDDTFYETVFKGFEIDFQEECATGIGINFAAGILWDSRVHGDLIGATKRIQNCYLHNHYNVDAWHYPIIIATGPYTCDNPPFIGLSPLEDYPCGWNSSNIEILDNIITDTARDAINLYPANNENHIDNSISNVLIRGNKISFINCDALPCGSNPKDGGGYPAGSAFMMKNPSNNVTIEYNYVQHVYGSGLAANAESGAGHLYSTTNHVWRYNIIRDIHDNGIKIKGAGKKSIDVYGNIFMDSDENSIVIGVEGFADDLEMRIYNNVIYEASGTPFYVSSNTGNIIDLDIRNNIFYAASGLPVRDDDGDITNHENNLYYSSGGGNLVVSGGIPYTSTNLNSYEPSSLSSNPLFVNLANPPTGFSGTYGTNLEPNNNGFSLQLSSPCIDSGIGLSDSYSGSISSIARPQGYGWDIGAYEFVLQQFYHRSDTNQDGCVNTEEMIAFMDRWKISSSDVPMPELMESVGLWKAGTGCN